MGSHRFGAVAALVAAWGIAARAQAGEWVSLTEDGLESWREERGQWLVAGEARPDPRDERLLASSDGSGVLVNGAEGRTVNLLSKIEHGDVEAHLEFMVPKGSNSGVYFQGRYEIQVFDSWGVTEPKHSDCGGIYERWKDEEGYEGHPPRVNAAKAPGEWQAFDVIFRAPRFDAQGAKTANALFVRVLHNGKVVHENVEVTGPTRASAYQDEKPMGPLMLQGDHGPVAYRNIRIRHLEAGETAWQSLFDGTSLRGWKPSAFPVQGQISAKEGELVIGWGDGCSGVTWTNDFPRIDYEVRLEAKRVDGTDFFCGMTFPVEDAACTLIVGGWGGVVVGLSSIDGLDASENETRRNMRFVNGRWYAIRLCVTRARIEAWIDDEKVVDQSIAGRRFSIRTEVQASRPFGIASWCSTAALRGIRLRLLAADAAVKSGA